MVKFRQKKEERRKGGERERRVTRKGKRSEEVIRV